MISLQRCPKCGNYMNNFLKKIFGGTKIVYICECGYNSEESYTGLQYSDRTSGKNLHIVKESSESLYKLIY